MPFPVSPLLGAQRVLSFVGVGRRVRPQHVDFTCCGLYKTVVHLDRQQDLGAGAAYEVSLLSLASPGDQDSQIHRHYSDKK
jgi:hypothetical protein